MNVPAAPSNAPPGKAPQVRRDGLDLRLPASLIDLHIHVGGAVAPHILYSIAMQQGFKLPVKSYWEFVELVTIRPGTTKSLDDYLKVMHEWTEKIQSSPAAIERAVYEIIGKEYRSSRCDQIELRFNPMKRNLHGERDLDHIIHAALRGMDVAVLEYGVKCCLLFCLAREWSYELNEIILEKAIKYQSRGVLGIDLAGPESNNLELRGKDAGYPAAWGDLVGQPSVNAEVGLRLAVPLDRNSVNAELEAAELDVKREGAELERQENLVRFAVENALAALHTDLTLAGQAQRQQHLADLKLKAQMEKYKTGLSTLQDVVRFQRELDDAMISVQRVMRAVRVGRTQLLRNTGALHDVVGVSVGVSVVDGAG
jgi:hypothetical protein